jgi:hypothetical protein
LDLPFDIDVMLSCNNVLLTTQLPHGRPWELLPNHRPVDASRNLEHDWIMGTLEINLIYLEARRCREQGVKENRG